MAWTKLNQRLGLVPSLFFFVQLAIWSSFILVLATPMGFFRRLKALFLRRHTESVICCPDFVPDVEERPSKLECQKIYLEFLINQPSYDRSDFDVPIWDDPLR